MADVSDGFFDVFPMTKGTETKETFTGRTEAGAWSTYHMRSIEHQIEELPGFHAARGFHPDVGSIDSAVYSKPCFSQGLANYAGISQIVRNEILNLSFACLGIYRRGGYLHRI